MLRNTFWVPLFMVWIGSGGIFLSAAQEIPPLKDNSLVSISLSNYNVSEPSGESVEYFYTLLPKASATILLTDIPGEAYFVMVQAHTYVYNVTLSYNPVPTYSTSVTGTNIGLWKAVYGTVKFYLSYPNAVNNATLMIAVQAYSHEVPTPGGCNMEFPTEIAPYLRTTYDYSTVSVTFACGSPPPSLLAWLNLMNNHSCLLNPEDHTMYRVYLPERDFSEDLYFTTLQSMMTWGRIQKVAHPVPLKVGSAPLRRIFAAYPGTGSAYVVVVQLLTDRQTAVYVPTISYGCDVTPGNDTCTVLSTTFSKLLCAVIFFLGLFACFAGHSFFYMETFLLGFLAGSLIFYSALFHIIESDILPFSVGAGAILGVILVIIFSCNSFPLLSVVLASSTLGYIIAAICLLPLIDYVDVSWDINYWVLYCSIIIMVPALTLSLAEKANMLSTSILGAYAAIIPIDHYLGSNVRFILVNSIRRATVPKFRLAIIDLPFQDVDIALVFTWVLLSFCGFLSQSILMKNKPPFPPPNNPRRWLRRILGPRTPNERTPLLHATSAMRS